MYRETNNLTYILYARKSEESEDRQVQSIDNQINDLKNLANRLNLTIKKQYTETRSAKKPNNRPLFDEMLKRIENGEAQGVLCWHINRLSRNPIDSGKLSWMLQQGVLKSIQTMEKEYLPDDNVILFNVETGSANQFILDLRKAVKRGIDSKLAKGWRPGGAPQGYLNSKIKDRGDNDILKDPERFDLVRQMWDLMLRGTYTPPQILNIANNEWGYRTRKTKKQGNLPLSRSGIYKIFNNSFYAGIFEYGKERIQYQGKHEKMITLDEFDKVQKLLGKDGRPRPQTHCFAYTGTIHCAECGCLFTAIEKEKIIKKTGDIKKFTYYYCTRKKRDILCTQKKSLTKDNLEIQIEKTIKKHTIIPDFLNWALEDLNELNDKEVDNRADIYKTQQKAMADTQEQFDELTKMRYRRLIDDETFLREKKDLQIKIVQLKQRLQETESRAERWHELTEKTFAFAAYAEERFLSGGLELKKEILVGLGYNPIVREGELIIEPKDYLVPIINLYPPLMAEYSRLEPAEIGQNTHKKEAVTSIRVRWRGRRDSNP